MLWKNMNISGNIVYLKTSKHIKNSRFLVVSENTTKKVHSCLISLSLSLTHTHTCVHSCTSCFRDAGFSCTRAPMAFVKFCRWQFASSSPDFAPTPPPPLPPGPTPALIKVTPPAEPAAVKVVQRRDTSLLEVEVILPEAQRDMRRTICMMSARPRCSRAWDRWQDPQLPAQNSLLYIPCLLSTLLLFFLFQLMAFSWDMLRTSELPQGNFATSSLYLNQSVWYPMLQWGNTPEYLSVHMIHWEFSILVY